MKPHIFAGFVAMFIGLVWLGGILVLLFVDPTAGGVLPPSAIRGGAAGPTEVMGGPGETVEITLFAGELDSFYVFGLKEDQLATPGPTIRVKVGTTVKIVFTNVGTNPHTLKVMGGDQPSDDPTVPVAFAGAMIDGRVDPEGGTASLTFTVDKPGKFWYACVVPGHIERGMFGTLEVIEG
jgi:Putative multicopper oxidases